MTAIGFRKKHISLLKCAILFFLLSFSFNSHSQDWTFVKGYGTLPYYATYGTQGIANQGNTPGARHNAVSWESGGKFYVFGGIGAAATDRGYLNDLWEYDPVTTHWRWMKGSSSPNQHGTYGIQGTADAANTPGARVDAAAWESGGKLYLFGGYGYSATGDDLLNDLWEYDLSTNHWRWIKGSDATGQVGSYGTLGTAASGNAPGARQNAESWVSGGKLYLFGGVGYPASGIGELNDLWEYDTVTEQWRWIKGNNGVNQTGVYGTLGTAASANTPGARHSTVGWEDNGKLYLFGGYGYAASGAGLLNDLWEYDITTSQWRWVKGSNAINQAGTYGTIGTAAAANIPRARESAAAWISGGKVYLFGGESSPSSGQDYLNDLWEYDPVSTYWRWIKGSNAVDQPGIYGTRGVVEAANAPGATRRPVTWELMGKLYMFGGHGYAASGAGYLNSLWEYDPVTTDWRWMTGTDDLTQNGVYGTLGTAASANIPGARDAAAAWKSGNKLYLFGGQSGSGSDLKNDFWEYDLATTQWRWITGSKDFRQSGVYGTQGTAASANSPGARRGAVSWETGGKLYLFGGVGLAASGSGYLNDLWEFDPAASQWRWIKGDNSAGQTAIYGTLGTAAAGNTPGAREGAAGWVSGGKLYLIGGSGSGASAMNDFWEYDPSTTHWRWLKGNSTADQPGIYGTMGTAAANNVPGARSDATAWTIGDKLYLYGGRGYGNFGQQLHFNDLWEYDLATGYWRWIKGSNSTNRNGTYGTLGISATSNTPGGRIGAAGWEAGGRLYLFGGRGYAASGDGYLNDLWEYDPAATNWRWIKGSNSTYQTGTYSAVGVAAIANNPGGRKGAATWEIASTLYLFGGNGLGVYVNDSDSRGDLWSYSLPISQPVVSSFLPTSAAEGATITITGTDLTGATAVGFGSTAAATFTVNSSTSIRAVVGAGASGSVSVTTAGGTATLPGFSFMSSDATLSALLLTGGTLSPAFSAVTTSYTSSVANSVSTITVTPTVSSGSATIKVNGTAVASGVASGNIILNVGNNIITTEVIAQDGSTTKSYSVIITRAPSADATLSSLTLTDGILSPMFSVGAASYTSSVPNSVTSTTVTPTVSSGSATITVNGTAVASGVASGNISLNVGVNTITTEVTAQDGSTTKTYTLSVTRAPSVDATLSSLTLTDVILSPVFSGDNTSYTSLVSNSVTSTTVTPTPSSVSASIKVNGTTVASGAASSYVGLNVGMNIITIEITAQNGITTQTYTVAVTRDPAAAIPLASNADLAAVSASGVSFSPAFSPATTSYTASVPFATSSVTLTAPQSESSANIVINGQIVNRGSSSAPITLKPGRNVITVLVTAGDGTTTKTYTFTIDRAAGSSAAALSSLRLSAGTMSQLFNPTVMAYTAYVNNAVDRLTLTAIATDAAASMTVNGAVISNGSASAQIALAVGSNVLTTRVTSENGSFSSSYTVNVIRLAIDQALTDQAGNANTDNIIKEVIVISPTGSVNVNIPRGNSTIPVISYIGMIVNGSGTIPHTVINTAVAKVEIPAATTVTGSAAGWDGTIAAPRISAYEFQHQPGKIITKGLVIEVGSENFSLKFARAVRLVLYGQAGMRVARVHENTFTEITNIARADTQTEGDLLAADESSKMDLGSDLVIWTRGFSKFITFSVTTDLDLALVASDIAAITPESILPVGTGTGSVTMPLTLPASGSNGSTITWTSDKPAIISHDGKTINRSLFGSGNVTVTVTATVTKGAITETKAITLVVPELPNQAPTLDFLANRSLCYTSVPQTITLTGISPGPERGQITSLNVTSSNPAMFSGLTVNSTNGVISFTPASVAGGTTTLTVTVRDNGGTANGGTDAFTRTFSVTVNPQPGHTIFSSTGSDKISKGAAITISTGGGQSYAWANVPGIISGQNTASILIRPAVTTTYTVDVTNASGCTGTQSFTIQVVEDYLALEVNNILTPNGDGINDHLVVTNLDMYPNNGIKIFDSAGRLIYAKANYANDWNATFQGSPLAEGTYFYVIEFGKGSRLLKGFVSIVN